MKTYEVMLRTEVEVVLTVTVADNVDPDQRDEDYDKIKAKAVKMIGEDVTYTYTGDIQVFDVLDDWEVDSINLIDEG